MKYPAEKVSEARKHYGFDEEEADRLSVEDTRQVVMNLTETRGKPEGLTFYTAREIAEMIKDIDRSS